MICFSFGKLYHGMGMQMTTDGIGAYYKQLWSLSQHSQFIGDAGVHFDKSQQKIDMFGYNNNCSSVQIYFSTLPGLITLEVLRYWVRTKIIFISIIGI